MLSSDDELVGKGSGSLKTKKYLFLTCYSRQVLNCYLKPPRLWHEKMKIFHFYHVITNFVKKKYLSSIIFSEPV